ncbi:MAG: AAA family ATPase [Lachnospiraceae bacterium]|nr:AAA family ATPase [Lachnospiraceae bacterium]
MGTYLNPGNSGFARITGTDYIDKTGLIGLLNRTIGTTRNQICVSRPRRFGKSYAAQMLCAYYDKTCDSHELFEKYEIAQDESYEKYIGKYDVIYWDMAAIKPYTAKYRELVPFLINQFSKELKEQYPEVVITADFSDTLSKATEIIGNKFIIMIDEWDAPIRENPEVQEDYLEFLRSLFKNSGTTSKIFAAAYMTGILPIKKDGSQSPLSEFREYTMIKPRKFGEYVGFTEEEVKRLCKEHNISFASMKRWYDGYDFKEVGAVYNPNSVMLAIENEDFDSYWTESSAAEGLMRYISKPYNGLTKTIAELIGGVDVKVNTTGFANDLVTFRGKDDVLTLMIHLGYLAYDSETGTVHIPNEEIKLEFQKAIREVDHAETNRRLNESDRLFLDTINGNEEAVAAQIEKIHREETSPLHYNKEDSLRSVIKLAYYTYRDNYLQWEELPAGDGYADIVYLPKRDSDWPVLVVELKWNKRADGAIDQILAKHYPDVIKNYGSDILLVGINYDKDAPAGEKKHECRIVKYKMES